MGLDWTLRLCFVRNHHAGEHREFVSVSDMCPYTKLIDINTYDYIELCNFVSYVVVYVRSL
jgi:hypothetical protein